MTVGSPHQAVLGHRRSRDVPAQTFESRAVGGADVDGGVELEARPGSYAKVLAAGELSALRASTARCAWGGDHNTVARRHRGALKQELSARVQGLTRVGLGSPFEETADAVLDTAQDHLEILISGRPNTMKAHPAIVGLVEDPFRREDMRVRVQPGPVCKPLDLEHAAGVGGDNAPLSGAHGVPAGELVGEQTEDP